MTGAEYTPGIAFLIQSDPTRCSNPLPAITIPYAYATGRIHATPRNASGVRLASTRTASTNPVSQTRNVKMGRGRNGKRARIARTAGVYTERKSGTASSATLNPNATQRDGPAHT